MSWKDALRRDPGGFYRLRTEQGEVRIFMTEALLAEAEEALGAQIENARRFPGVLDAVLTPDAHHGYGVPVGCVMATSGTLAMGPVGYDIGCGIAALRSVVPREEATPDRVRDFSKRVMQCSLQLLPTITTMAFGLQKRLRNAAPALALSRQIDSVERMSA